MRRTLLVFLFVSVAVLVAAPSAEAAASYHFVRLFYYQDSDLAKKSFFAHPGSIDIFAPQTYKARSDGTISGTVDADLLVFAKKHKIKVMPLITNDRFTQSSYQAVLDDQKTQDVIIAALIQEARDHGYAGWQFDFEQMDASYKDKYSAFIARAHDEFKKSGIVTSVAVVSKVSDNPSDYKKDLWQKLIGVYDYSALASSTDFVSLMSYDDPESWGPVVEYPWLTRVLVYSLAHMPANKISLGIPLYYWKWNDVTGKLVDIGGNKSLDTVFKKYAVHVNYDTTEQAPSVYYVVQGVPYTIWYENARSVAAKMKLVKNNKLYGASFWALGLELPSIYNSIKQ